MDRNQRSRRQKSANGSYAQQSRRSMGSRLGLEKRNAPRPKAPPEKAAPTPHVPPRQRPAQEINPQKAGYRPGTPRRTRRVTQAEIIRAKRRRRLLGALGVLAVLAVAVKAHLPPLRYVKTPRMEWRYSKTLSGRSTPLRVPHGFVLVAVVLFSGMLTHWF